MKLNNLIGLGLGAAVIYFLLGKKNLAKSATFSFEKMGIDLRNKKIKLSLGANNPTNSSATLKSIIGNLYLAGKQVASVESFNTVQILPNAKTIVTIDVRPSLAGIWSTIKTILQNKGKSAAALKATFEGTANVDGISFPIKTALS